MKRKPPAKQSSRPVSGTRSARGGVTRGGPRGGVGGGRHPDRDRSQGSGPGHGHARGRGPGGRENRQGPAGKEQFSAEGRWVIGIHSCQEVINTRPHAVAEVLFRPDWQHSEAHRKMAEVLEAMEIPIHSRALESLNPLGSGHQGAAMRVTEDPVVDWDALSRPGQAIVLILDGIEDPQNLGAMLRTSWLTGVKAIFIPEDRAVGLTPVVNKIASGGAEHVAVDAHVNFGPVIQRLKDSGFWIYGLAEGGRARPWDLKLPEKVAWVIGSEGSGMRVPTERMCDELVRLPQVSSGSSFNAAIAAAMALAETCRQFGKPE